MAHHGPAVPMASLAMFLGGRGDCGQSITGQGKPAKALGQGTV